jgi:ADP-heptose:LPS heptosyltransferase
MRNVLFRLLFLIVRASRPTLKSRSDPKTLLMLQYAIPLGCCVHDTPLYAAIKRFRPDTTIIVASCGLGLETLRHDSHVDHLIDTPDPMASFHSLWKTVQILRRYLNEQHIRIDMVLQNASNRRGRYALLALFLRVAPTTGFADAPQLYDHHLRYDSTLSLIDNNLRLANDSGHLEPEVYFTASELAHVRTMLRESNPRSLPVTAFVVQGSGGQQTGWHDERFVEVIRHVDSLGHLPVFVGTGKDATTIERILGLSHFSGRSFAGQTSVPELAALLCLCDLVITLDTGTMHVARAVNIPTVVLGPSWQKPLEWLPLGRANVRILRGADRADVPHGYRLDEIGVESVTAAVDELCREYPASVDAREQRVAQRLSTTRS